MGTTDCTPCNTQARPASWAVPLRDASPAGVWAPCMRVAKPPRSQATSRSRACHPGVSHRRAASHFYVQLRLQSRPLWQPIPRPIGGHIPHQPA